MNGVCEEPEIPSYWLDIFFTLRFQSCPGPTQPPVNEYQDFLRLNSAGAYGWPSYLFFRVVDYEYVDIYFQNTAPVKE